MNQYQEMLNTARNCLRYIIKAFEIKELHLPYYTCPVVWQSAKKENCKIKFYHIDKNFMPAKNFNPDSYIVYTNYFGICAGNVKKLSEKYENLIVDNAQAFYMPKYGLASFNSLRKFFDVPDGAIVYSNKKSDTTFEKDTYCRNYDYTNIQLYSDAFYKNENRLCNEPIKQLSDFTKSLFENIDTEKAKQKRLENFHTLAKELDKSNELNIKSDTDDVPMVYPYLKRNDNLRQKLSQNGIPVEQYWNPTAENSQEAIFQKYLLPLPIDPKYNNDYLLKIIQILKTEL